MTLYQRFRALDRRRRIQVLATASAALLVIVTSIVMLTGWAAGPTVDDYLEDSGIANRPKLRIGISGNAPLLAFGTDQSSTKLSDYQGFDVEIARSLAEYLGFDPDSVEIRRTAAQNRPLLLNRHEVDIVLAGYSMTDEREAKDVDFAGPYILTSPEVLMREPNAPKSLTMSNLRDFGRKLCTTGSSTSEDALRDSQITDFDGVNTAADCAAGLLNKTYDAFMLDEVILAGHKSQYDSGLALVDLVLNQTERYGIAVANHNEKLRTVICNFLWDSFERKENGAWQHAWNKTLDQVLTKQRQPQPDDCLRLRDYRDRIGAASLSGIRSGHDVPPGGDWLTINMWRPWQAGFGRNRRVRR